MKQIGNFGGGTTSGGTTKETISKVKTSRETVTSSTTLQNDDDFSFSVKANTTYALTANFVINSVTAAGMKWEFSVPSGTTGRLISNAGTVFFPNDTDITTGANLTVGYNVTNSWTSLAAFITTSSTAGTVTFRWSQSASNATGTYIERGSTMILTEV